jgi:adenine-specific DNA-methyltransferase
VWLWQDVGHNQDAKREVMKLNPTSPFSTPKPEKLIHRIIHIASDENDLILDSFLGSATTAAVAQKMNRRYIGIEIGDHAQTHCQPRLQKVVDGEQGGISKSLEWTGGGGFRFCKLGQTVFDEFGCLNPEIKFPTLAAHIWYLETKTTMSKKKRSPYLGTHNNTAYYLLYNGILGDRRPDGGNVLTTNILNSLPKIDEHEGKIVIYGESSRLGEARLSRANITFKQIPYDVGSL